MDIKQKATDIKQMVEDALNGEANKGTVLCTVWFDRYTTLCDWLHVVVEEVLQDAVNTERERCAEIADSFPDLFSRNIGKGIATSIRGPEQYDWRHPMTQDTPEQAAMREALTAEQILSIRDNVLRDHSGFDEVPMAAWLVKHLCTLAALAAQPQPVDVGVEEGYLYQFKAGEFIDGRAETVLSIEQVVERLNRSEKHYLPNETKEQSGYADSLGRAIVMAFPEQYRIPVCNDMRRYFEAKLGEHLAALSAQGGVVDAWLDISDRPTAETLAEFKLPDDTTFIAPLINMATREMSAAEKAALVRMTGEWPQAKYNPVAFRLLPAAPKQGA